jgi:integrase
MLDHVRIKRFCELSGYTDDAVRSKISSGVWIEGQEWRRTPTGEIVISLQGYDAWAEGRECVPSAGRPSRSISDGRASGAGNVSDLSRRRQTSSTPPDSRQP